MQRFLTYTKEYYRKHQESSRRSAREIVPLILGLVQPGSVIDVGCGVGTWLSVFREFGVEDVLGVDGEWIDRDMLEIPPERFRAFDLEQPFRMDRQFDLVVSLEVAEHLPGECAEIFVDSLVRLGPIILFSAAIPFQGGEHHVNEQWPEYWEKLFQQKRYVVIDCLRKRTWQNANVDWTYAQNMFCFARPDRLDSHPVLKKELEETHTSQLSIVHPRKYLEVIDWTDRWVKGLQLAVQDITGLIPPEDAFILVDQAEFGTDIVPGRRAIPFLERDGQYWGAPPDDETAVQEFERLRQSGASFIVFAWPAFWWLDYYSELHRHLRANFRCVLENDRFVVFDLRP